MKRTIILMSLAGILLISQVSLGFIYNGFSDMGGLTLNGDAVVENTDDGAVVRLSKAEQYAVGSLYTSEAVSVSDFSSYFRFRVIDAGGKLNNYNSESGADGIAFVIQGVGPNALGGDSCGMGYEGIAPSVVIEFDTWKNAEPDDNNNDPDSNHIGIMLNGNINHGEGAPDTASVEERFDDGEIWYVWIDYDGQTLEIRMSQSDNKPDNPLLSKQIDIASILSGGTGYVGFSSATGQDWGNYDLIYWSFDKFNSGGGDDDGGGDDNGGGDDDNGGDDNGGGDDGGGDNGGTDNGNGSVDNGNTSDNGSTSDDGGTSDNSGDDSGNTNNSDSNSNETNDNAPTRPSGGCGGGGILVILSIIGGALLITHRIR